MKINLTIPSLLIIDTPGHEAFTTLRKRGGAIADIAILVVDINEGFKPQTDESINYLKQFKTPFVVAVTKMDKLISWNPTENACFSETFENQTDRTKGELEEKVYRIIGQLSERGFQSERIDRLTDFKKQIAVVPVSSISGEGISDLLVVLAGIAQKFLKKGLEVKSGVGKGTILEVKEFTGLGTTIDVILYDGKIKKGDFLVIGGKNIVKTKIKAILEPKPLRELRTGKDFNQIEHVVAAAGLKIAAPGLENVIAGSPLRSVRSEDLVQRVGKELEKEIEEVEIETDKKGVLLKADTLGSLEALIKTLKEKEIPIRKAIVGAVSKSDIDEMRTLEEPIIFAFNVKIGNDIKTFAKDNGVEIFSSDVIYKLIEDHEKWLKDKDKREEEKVLKEVSRPAKVKILKGCIFRQKNPAVFGVEVLKGILKPKIKLTKEGKVIGEVKEIQKEGENVEEAKRGDKVAVSMEGVIVGKHVNEGDELYVYLSEENLERLEAIKGKLGGDELELLEEMDL